MINIQILNRFRHKNWFIGMQYFELYSVYENFQKSSHFWGLVFESANPIILYNVHTVCRAACTGFSILYFSFAVELELFKKKTKIVCCYSMFVAFFAGTFNWKPTALRKSSVLLSKTTCGAPFLRTSFASIGNHKNTTHSVLKKW